MKDSTYIYVSSLSYNFSFLLRNLSWYSFVFSLKFSIITFVTLNYKSCLFLPHSSMFLLHSAEQQKNCFQMETRSLHTHTYICICMYIYMWYIHMCIYIHICRYYMYSPYIFYYIFCFYDKFYTIKIKLWF